MKFFKNLIFLNILWISLHNNAKSQDLTEDGKYGCIWQGGSASRLLCNCDRDAEMTIKQNSITASSTAEIIVNGCKSLKIEENSIVSLRNLRSITLNNINFIYFESGSINWYGYKDNNGQRMEEERFDVRLPSLRLSVSSSNISQISTHSFAGRISEIFFENVVIETILPLAFVNLLQTEKVIIRNTVLKDLGVQSFKSFSTEYLELSEVSADLIPSRAFSNITVYQNVTIDNCQFNTIRSGGFTIYNPRAFQITNSTIRHVYGEAFKIISTGIIIFRDNTFGIVDDGAFSGITLRRDIVLGDILFIFDSNKISSLSTFSLKMSEPGVQFRRILLNGPCDCTAIDEKIKDNSYYDEIMCIYENEYTNLYSFKTNMCSVISNYYIIIIIVCVIITLVLAILVGLFFYYKLVYKSEKYGDKKSTQKNMSLIIPDGRTYRETELHVIVERTDLLTTDL